jgi:hypothetical protein
MDRMRFRWSTARVVHDRPADRTVKRKIDVERAFRDAEEPTRPTVVTTVPLDAIPVLALPREELPLSQLGRVTAQILDDIDGNRDAMSLATLRALLPSKCVRELASLVVRGWVRLAPVADPGPLLHDPSSDND